MDLSRWLSVRPSLRYLGKVVLAGCLPSNSALSIFGLAESRVDDLQIDPLLS